MGRDDILAKACTRDHGNIEVMGKCETNLSRSFMEFERSSQTFVLGLIVAVFRRTVIIRVHVVHPAGSRAVPCSHSIAYGQYQAMECRKCRLRTGTGSVSSVLDQGEFS